MAKTAAAAAEIIDEYSLKENELTKEQVADRAAVSLRAVEIWKSKGLLPAQKVRRRITDPNTGKPVIKQVLIFMADDVEKFMADRDAPVEIPTVDRPTAGTALAAREKRDDLSLMLMHSMAQATGLLPNPRKPFIPIAEAAAEYELSVPGIHALIDDGEIKAFSGPHGKKMVSRRQIESL